MRRTGRCRRVALKWEVRFQHAEHWHPYLAELVGAPQSFQTATSGETAADVWYRVILRATDSVGSWGRRTWTWCPTAVLTLRTEPAGLRVTLDGQPVATPAAVVGVVGVADAGGAVAAGGVHVHGVVGRRRAGAHDQHAGGGHDVYGDFDAPTTTTSTTSTTAAETTTTTTTPTTSVTTTAPSTTTSPSTTSTIAASTTTTSTPVDTSSTTTSSSPTTSTTTSTFLASTTTTTSTTVPGCSPVFTLDAVGCRIDELTLRLSDSSTALGSAGPGLDRRVRRASDRVARAAALCAGNRPGRARAALRSALHQLNAIGAKLRSHSGQRLIPSDLAAQLGAQVAAAAADVKVLRDGLSCP